MDAQLVPIYGPTYLHCPRTLQVRAGLPADELVHLTTSAALRIDE